MLDIDENDKNNKFKKIKEDKSNESSKIFIVKEGKIKVDDTKIVKIVENNLLNKEIDIIFLDKIEYLGLISLRDIRIAFVGIGLFVIGLLAKIFEVPILRDYSWIMILLSFVMFIVFYFVKDNSMEIKASNTKMLASYNEALMEYLTVKIEEQKI